MINKDEYSWLILLYARVNENQQLNHGGPSQRHIVIPPTHWLKFYEEAIIYQYIPSGLKVIAIFKTDYGRMDMHWQG